MSTIIQIKRSPNVAAPTTVNLAEGELAYSYDKTNNGVGAKLYIEVLDSGDSPVIHEIGGKYYTDQIDNASSANTASSIVKRAANGFIEVGAIVATNIYGTLQGEVSSANIANFANALTTGRYIKLSGDVVGEAFFDGTGNADISASVIQANSVALGTDTTGDYVANVIAGAGINVTNQGGETATPTVALSNTGVSAGTYGDANNFSSITVDEQGRITAASNVTALTPSSIATLTNKSYDVSNAANNKFSIQGNDITSYSGSGSVVILQNSPTINTLFVRDSDLQLDGGSGTYWAGQSGVAQTGDNKAGIYRAESNANGSLFTFGANGAGDMSVAIDGSLFIGGTLPSNSGGLNTDYSGWLVVNSGGKFGGDINTLGALKFDDATNGYIQFNDGTIQRIAYTSNHLTTANVVEVTNLYFTNARATAALTSGNGISYNSTTGNITLAPTGVSANTYGGASAVPVLTIDEYGRITAAANVSVAGVSSFTASGNTFTIATADGGSFSASIQPDSIQLDRDTTGAYVANLIAGTGISLTGLGSENTTPTIALTTTGVSAGSYGEAAKVSQFTVDAEGRITTAANVNIAIPASALTTDVQLGGGTSGDYVANITAGTGIGITNGTGETSQPTITNLGVTSITGTANEISVSAANAAVTIGLPDNVTVNRDLTVAGNLYVTGNVVALPVEQLVVEDSLIQLANNNISTDVIDVGFY